MSTATSITVRVPLKIRRRPGRKTVVTPVLRDETASLSTPADPALLKALARAFRYQRLLDGRHYSSISEMAQAERIDRGYLGKILRLALLAPDLVEGIMEGRAPGSAALSELMGPHPIAWALQRSAFRAVRGTADEPTAGAPP